MMQCEPPAATARAPCMKRSDAVGVEGAGSRKASGEWCGQAPPMHATGAGTGVAVGAGAVSGR
jgi:hypothetical protein